MITLNANYTDTNPLEDVAACAMHEAAHAVIAIHYGTKVLELNGSPKGGYTQTDFTVPNLLDRRPTKREIRALTHYATIALAGPIMQAQLAVAYGQLSEDEKKLSLITACFRLHKINLDLDDCQKTAMRLLKLYTSAVKTLALALINKPVLSGEEVHAIVDPFIIK